MAKERLFGAVDLGADRFIVLAAQRLGSSYEIVGCGVADAAGVSGGKITDLTRASKVLTGAVHQAEVMAGGKFDLGVVAGVAGSHITGAEKQAHVKIQGGAVSESDIELAMDTLQAFPVPPNLEILHVLEQEYLIDGHGGIHSPLGMTGALLEADAYIVTALASALSNLRSCVTDAGVNLRRSMCSGLAVGSVISTADERDLGVLTLDWGATSCDIAVFQKGVPRLLRTLDLGGSEIDRDIAKMSRVSLHEAQRVKRAIGSAIQVQVDSNASIELQKTGGGKTSIEPHVLSMIIEARVDDLLRTLKQGLGDWLVQERLPAGVVLAGGMACLPGIVQISHDVLGVPVRIGQPNYSGTHAEEVSGPRFAAALGLLEMWKNTGFMDHQSATTGFRLGNWLKNLIGSPAVQVSNQ